MRNLKRWISALLAVVLLLSYGITGTVYAENQDHHSQAGGGMYGSDSTLVDSDYDGIPDEYDAAPNPWLSSRSSGYRRPRLSPLLLYRAAKTEFSS